MPPGNGLELAVGRIDFVNLPSLPKTELQLIQDYITKDDLYRRAQLTYPQQVIVGPWVRIVENYTGAMRNGSRLFGISPGKVIEGDCFNPVFSALLGYHESFANGDFGYTTTDYGLGHYYTSDFANSTNAPKVHFLAIRSSWIVDWDSQDNLMRGFLSIPNYGLGVTWHAGWKNATEGEGRVPHLLERTALGEAVGSEFPRTINESGLPSYQGNLYLSYLGDPTLRLQVITPPSNFTSTTNGSGITLSWTAEANVEYLIERTTALNYIEDGGWDLVANVTPFYSGTVTYEDAGATSGTTYRIRAQKLVSAGSGSYKALSQGAVATAN